MLIFVIEMVFHIRCYDYVNQLENFNASMWVTQLEK